MKKSKKVLGKVLGLSLLLLAGFQPVAQAETNGIESENAKPPLQIMNQTGLKVVVQVNYSDTIPNGISKQVLAVKNLYDQYAVLGLKSGKDYEIIMVFRADGAQFLLTDEVYDLKVKQPHPKGNPNKAMIEALHKGGVKMVECHVAMKLKGYKSEDIFPFSRIVVSGIGAVLDFEKSGYMEITP
jgi:intracellular sulfur oxidation DsrE/DsrF family protein